MVDLIKTDLRISHSQLDNDIESTINACELDLKLVGIKLNKDSEGNYDALIQKAITLYCRFFYDFNGKGEQYQKAYENLKRVLSLCGDYNV